MTAKNRTEVPTWFEPETRFTLRPELTAPFRAIQETELERLRGRLLQNLLTETPAAELNAPLHRAANEAAALAWLTPFPLLFLPVLFEEKAVDAKRRVNHQAEVLQRCRSSQEAAA